MLSNTAVPTYYAIWREQVLNGETAVNENIAMQMRRIDDKIADPRFYYDPGPIEGFISYCENEMTLTDGDDVKMLLSFKVWAEDALCWFYYVERSVYVPSKDNHGGHYEKRRVKIRLTKKQFLIVGRGAAKSLYAAYLHSYFLNVDTSTTQQIVTAPTMKQAEETIMPIRTAIARAKGPFFKFLTDGSVRNTSGSKADRVKLASTKKGIQNFLTNSIVEVLPMTIDKLQGYKPKISTVDEWLSGDIREDVIGAIEQGATKNKDYLIVACSSEGTVRNGPGDTIKLELKQILKGDYYAPHVSIFWYCLDSVDEVADSSMWVKAQPNIGITVSYEAYQLDKERAEQAPATRNDILAKRFGIPTEGYTYFFRYEETLCVPYKKEYWNCMCALGADMSQGDDFCAFDFLFPLNNGSFAIKCRSYITERTLMKLPAAMREKYEEFIDEGSLIIMNGTVLDMDEVYEDLMEHINQCGYDVMALGYDPYNADSFIQKWTLENSPYGIEKVRQGVRTETVPLGEIKILAEDNRLVFDQQLMSFCMGNCIAIEDTNGNRKLSKMRREQKIDNVSALLDAYVAYKAHKELFE